MATCMSEENNLEDFTVVWLDANIDKTKDCLDTQTQLRQRINYLKTFTNADECVDYVTKIQNEKVFFIVSGTMGEIVVPLIYDVPQIHSIYVFCGNKAKQEKWTKQCEKVSGIYIDKQSLLKKLQENIESCSKQLLPMSIFSPEMNGERCLQDLREDHATFMWYYFLIRILLLMPATHTNLAKHEMLEECRLYYKDNPPELAKIEDFENKYEPEKAIWWYTSDCFIYRLLNKALRTQNIEAIFKFRFFIADLHKQLCYLHGQYRELLGSDIPPFLTVYRGQGMPRIDFERLKKCVGGQISMNTFLSTTLDRELALMYVVLDRSSIDNSKLESVLFEIQVNMNIKTKPFCNIDHLSKFDDEKEVLFSIGTVFQVEAVELIENNIWNVKLISSDEYDKRTEKLTAHLTKEIGNSPNLLTLGWFLYRLGDFDKAERFYWMLLKQLPANHGDIGTIYNNLGLLYKDKCDYIKAVDYYSLALQNYARTRQEFHPQIGTTYSNMSAAYLSHGDLDMAKTSLEMAYQILSHSYKSDNPLLASIYNQLGQISYMSGNYEEALKHHKKALNMKLTFLPSDHISMATTYSNIGAALKENDDLRESLNYYQKALTVCIQSMPTSHPDFAKNYNNIGLVYLKNGDTTSALQNFETAYQIGLGTLRPGHPDIIEYENNIETAKNKLKSNSQFKKK
ncbi:unnamed protein product [Didymodactylos carnosus]|uniref:NAD(P)(+)--arginine ADP-ribosyltransferase n=1 Tax=Didymodactylos carnosus TaxID=1234261 RepID=A0A814UK54_9BILA|nr:unnamed protein product [Didymodactylos carnosus]CAF3938462.1 unnamed protein product [Didymodactylos carnosus]